MATPIGLSAGSGVEGRHNEFFRVAFFRITIRWGDMEYVDPIRRGTVWFLGAGFSRGLGAPLFRELFVSAERVQASNLNLPPAVGEVLNLYKLHSEGTRSGMGVLWRDPEEFIDILESARAPGRSKDLLCTISKSDPEALVDAARRLLALECSQFLRGASTDTERWLPYLKWASQFNKTHTVISFNYDRVLEFAQQQKFRDETNFYKIVVPGQDAHDGTSLARNMGCAPVLKLHGSVDWVARNGKIETDASDGLPASVSSGNDLILAVPGPDKGEFGSRFKDIGTLWRNAEDAVKNAGRIVFLGYRFPVTDARARVRFLDAIKFAIKGNMLKTVEIILGPDEKHPDVVRMKQLLSFVCKGSAVAPGVLPLYVEDYLPFSSS